MSACAPLPAPQSLSGRFTYSEGAEICAIGDTQRTSRLEFWREQNDRERAIVVGTIAARRPALIVTLGDHVFAGASRSEWAAFDALTAPWRSQGIPVLPTLGNHDYWGPNAKALANFHARFPHLNGKTWHSARFGPLALVFLDSNSDDLGPAAWQAQLTWLARTLEEADRDASVGGVLVFQHHPPYTNSSVTGDDKPVQEAFVPPFARAKKTVAMLSGHVHNYEHFVRNGKHFIVSGGGGGPRAELSSGSSRRYTDDLFQGPTLRQFHFLAIATRGAGVEVQAIGVAKGGTSPATFDRFSIPWPN